MALEISSKSASTEQHETDVNTLLFYKGKLYSGADDFKIKVWDENLKQLHEVLAHDCSVYSLAAINDTLYSCSNDGTLKSWTLDLKPLKTILKVDNELWKIHSDGTTLYVGDDVGTVRIFENDKQKAVYELLEPIKDLSVYGNLLYTVRDLYLTITEMIGGEKNRYTLKKTLVGKSPLCIIGQEKLCLCGRTGKEIILHENSETAEYREISTFSDAHSLIINAMQGTKLNADYILYTGGYDKVLKKWSLTSTGIQLVAECLVEFVVNTIAIGAVGQVFVGGDNGHLVRVDG